MFRSCPFEKEITQALTAGHWPDACGPELRAHVATCANCGDLVLVTEAFQRARVESAQETQPGSAGVLWWRAQLRSRNAATRKMSAPLAAAQIFAWLVTLLGTVAFVASQYRHGLHWASWWSELAPAHAFHEFSVAAAKLDWSLVLLAPSLGALLLLSGVVLYLVSERS